MDKTKSTLSMRRTCFLVQEALTGSPPKVASFTRSWAYGAQQLTAVGGGNEPTLNVA